MSRADTKGALGLLGLAVRAGSAVIGTTLICDALKKSVTGKAPQLILLARDAAPNTKKRITDRAAFYSVPLIEVDVGCEALALAVGKRGAAVAAVAVTDAGLGDAIAKRLQ